MNTVKAPQSATPPHPGRFVRTKIIEPRGLSVKDAASALGVHRVALSQLLNEQAALSPEMAVRLEKAFGADMVDLMRMQSEFDIRQARLKVRGMKVPGNVGAQESGGVNGRADFSRMSKDGGRGSVEYAESGRRKSNRRA